MEVSSPLYTRVGVTVNDTIRTIGNKDSTPLECLTKVVLVGSQIREIIIRPMNKKNPVPDSLRRSFAQLCRTIQRRVKDVMYSKEWGRELPDGNHTAAVCLWSFQSTVWLLLNFERAKTMDAKDATAVEADFVKAARSWFTSYVDCGNLIHRVFHLLTWRTHTYTLRENLKAEVTAFFVWSAIRDEWFDRWTIHPAQTDPTVSDTRDRLWGQTGASTSGTVIRRVRGWYFMLFTSVGKREWVKYSQDRPFEYIGELEILDEDAGDDADSKNAIDMLCKSTTFVPGNKNGEVGTEILRNLWTLAFWCNVVESSISIDFFEQFTVLTPWMLQHEKLLQQKKRHNRKHRPVVCFLFDQWYVLSGTTMYKCVDAAHAVDEWMHHIDTSFDGKLETDIMISHIDI